MATLSAGMRTSKRWPPPSYLHHSANHLSLLSSPGTDRESPTGSPHSGLPHSLGKLGVTERVGWAWGQGSSSQSRGSRHCQTMCSGVCYWAPASAVQDRLPGFWDEYSTSPLQVVLQWHLLCEGWSCSCSQSNKALTSVSC